MARELLVGVLGQDEPGRAEHGPGILAGRGEHVDRVVVLAVGHDEPVVVGADDAGVAGGEPAGVEFLACVRGHAPPGAGRGAAAAAERQDRLGEERGPGEQGDGEQQSGQSRGQAAAAGGPRITSGSGPMAFLLAAYRAGQPGRPSAAQLPGSQCCKRLQPGTFRMTVQGCTPCMPTTVQRPAPGRQESPPVTWQMALEATLSLW